MSFQFISDRLKEPSTWRGIALMAGTLGVGINPEAVQQIGVAVGAIFAAVEIFRKEK